MPTRIDPKSLFRSELNPKGAQFVRVPLWLLARTDVNPGAKLAYARLALFNGKRGCFPALTTLARELGVEERQARRYVDELVAAGVIEKQSQGKGRANRIYFLAPLTSSPPPSPEAPVSADRTIGPASPVGRTSESDDAGHIGPPAQVVGDRYEAEDEEEGEEETDGRMSTPTTEAAEPCECGFTHIVPGGDQARPAEGRPGEAQRPPGAASGLTARDGDRPPAPRVGPQSASVPAGQALDDQLSTDATDDGATSKDIEELEQFYRQHYKAGRHGDLDFLPAWGPKERGQARTLLRKWAKAPEVVDWAIEHMLLDWRDVSLRLKIPGAPSIGLLLSGWCATIAYEAQTEGNPPSGYHPDAY